MNSIIIDGVTHAAVAVGPEAKTLDREGCTTFVSAHVLACDSTRYAGTLPTYGAWPELEGLCSGCHEAVGDLIRKHEHRAAARAAGYPTNTYESLNQTKWWHPKKEGWVEIAEMGPQHAANVCGFLEHRAFRYGHAYIMAAMMMLPNEDECGDMTYYAVWGELAQLEKEVLENPREWIKTTPLYKAMLERAKQ